MIVTASLTTGVARVADGMPAAIRLVDLVFRTHHSEWETTMYVGDVEFHRSRDGPYPSHQLRISVQPATGYSALNYIDHDDLHMTIANSFNPQQPPPEVRLIFNGTSGSVFPRSAAIPIGHARAAVIEWLRTRKRPTCIAWQSFDNY
jgi:Immunity protein Imm1